MTGRGDEVQAEALKIVEGVVERMDLELAAVAGAGIDLADRQAAAEPPPRRMIDARRQLRQCRVVGAAAAASVSGGRIMPSNRVLAHGDDLRDRGPNRSN